MMELNFTWINLLILFGALQGLIFSVILLFNRQHPGAKFLAIFLLVLTYNGFETFNWSAGLDRYQVFFDLFSFTTIYAIGPALYLYTRSLLEPGLIFRRKQVMAHFSVFLFHFITRLLIIGYHMTGIAQLNNWRWNAGAFMSLIWTYAEPLSVLLFCGYVIASWIVVRRAGRVQLDEKQETNKLSARDLLIRRVKEQKIAAFRWARLLNIMCTAFASGWFITLAGSGFVGYDAPEKYYPIELGLVMMVYWVVLTGYHRIKQIGTMPLEIPEENNPPGMSVSEMETQFLRLQEAMVSKKIYQDPELSLAKLSQILDMPSRTISAVLNQHGQVSFNDFVNGYRVEEVGRKILDPANQQLTILGIAFDAGFNSQATFQRAFKKQTGMSPRDFLNSNKINIA